RLPNNSGLLNKQLVQLVSYFVSRTIGALRSAPLLILLSFLCGCVTTQQTDVATLRKFDFQKDTFAYSNDLLWEYYFNAHGKWVSRRRQPRPDYTHHCFVVARTTRQFFFNARFDPGQSIADEDTYWHLIRQVAGSNSCKPASGERSYIVPCYSDLRSFRRATYKMFKRYCCGSWSRWL